MFRSISVLEQERPSLLSTTNLPLHDYRKNQFMNSGFGANPILFNPSNGRHRILPDVFSCAKEQVRSFLGFGSETGFKVLAIKKDACKVLTLDTLIWTTLNFIPHHKPASSSICINGIIYYAAYLKPTIMALISFCLETESFRINQIPQRPRFGNFFCEKIMNVNGNIGISFAAGCDMHMVRILENRASDLFSPVCFEGFTKLGLKKWGQRRWCITGMEETLSENTAMKV